MWIKGKKQKKKPCTTFSPNHATKKVFYKIKLIMFRNRIHQFLNVQTVQYDNGRRRETKQIRIIFQEIKKQCFSQITSTFIHISKKKKTRTKIPPPKEKRPKPRDISLSTFCLRLLHPLHVSVFCFLCSLSKKFCPLCLWLLLRFITLQPLLFLRSTSSLIWKPIETPLIPWLTVKTLLICEIEGRKIAILAWKWWDVCG